MLLDRPSSSSSHVAALVPLIASPSTTAFRSPGYSDAVCVPVSRSSTECVGVSRSEQPMRRSKAVQPKIASTQIRECSPSQRSLQVTNQSVNHSAQADTCSRCFSRDNFTSAFISINITWRHYRMWACGCHVQIPQTRPVAAHHRTATWPGCYAALICPIWRYWIRKWLV